LAVPRIVTLLAAATEIVAAVGAGEEQRFRPDEQPVPARAGQQARESSKHGSVCPVHPRPGHPASQHRDLVAQHEQLGVLGGRAPRQQRKPPHHLAEQQIEQS
jgi:hypothetical protein